MTNLTPKEYQEKWIEALESGKYQQGTKKLTKIIKGQEFDCCLGVACKIYLEVNGLDSLKIYVKEDTYEKCTIKVYNGDEAGLPFKVMKAFGINHPLGNFSGGLISSLNDRGSSFGQIAETIRQRPKGLFVED